MKCKKCGNIIPVGNIICNKMCETCAGIRNPYDNPEDYKYFWNGKLCTLDELPEFAKMLYPNLRKKY